jgi:hypothetical protein
MDTHYGKGQRLNWHSFSYSVEPKRFLTPGGFGGLDCVIAKNSIL